MAKSINITGKKFGRLTAIRFLNIRKKHEVWLFKCDCGQETQKQKRLVVNGITSSCGCLFKEAAKVSQKKNFYKHGLTGKRTFEVWRHLINRIENKNDKDFCNYGGRGIKLCDEWHDPLKFHNWALSHGYKENLTIDRIDVDGNYCPENCRWVSFKEQASNKRETLYVVSENRTRVPICRMFEGQKAYNNIKARMNRRKIREISISTLQSWGVHQQRGG